MHALKSEATSMAQRLRERQRPAEPCVMYQEWRELLFLHWAVDAEVVQARLPDALRVDCFEGKAWIGVVPFFMRGVRPRGLPSVPGISDFLELNLRTYVVDKQGRPGVWFFSLDTSHRLPVWIARKFFHLPYCHARMRASESEAGMEYHSSRRMLTDWDEAQRYCWSRRGALRKAEPGSLEFFLVERYRLFSHDARKDRLYTGQVHHAPYQFCDVDLRSYSTRLFALDGLATPLGPPDSVIASPGGPVSIHALKRVS
ncbi:MAG: DUF2071 domain-containing protein [Verrucomicrobia bacterium]|nr:DUF2071 domain-containing protein [Verrucomicrobiota bacterium]